MKKPEEEFPSEQWREWIACQKISHFRNEHIIDLLVGAGFDEREARREVETIAADPYVALGRKLFQRSRKIEYLITILKQLRDSG